MNDAELNERVQYVRVTNGLPFAFVDMYDGVPVTIPAGKSENLRPDMAWHFFGYAGGVGRAEMLRHTSKRHGWNTPEFVSVNENTGKTKAEEYFDKIKIEAVIYKLVPAEVNDPQEPVPADSPPPQIAGRFVPKRVEVNVT